jgi:hypothetical protein
MLTLSQIKKYIAKHKDKVDQTVDIDNDVVSIWTVDGYAFDARENRHVENLNIGDYNPDNMAFLKECISRIELEA